MNFQRHLYHFTQLARGIERFIGIFAIKMFIALIVISPHATLLRNLLAQTFNEKKKKKRIEILQRTIPQVSRAKLHEARALV